MYTELIQTLKELFSDNTLTRNLLLSFLLVIFAFGFRFIGRQAIIKSTIQSENLKQRWFVQIRNLSFLVVLFGLAIIWGTELRTIALSLLAIAAAIVIATKELILCFTGSVYKAGSNLFSVGDKISVGSIRGIVSDQTLLATTLFEIGPGMDSHQITGKKIVIPNAMFLTQPVTNENSISTYTLHSFSLKVKSDKPVLKLEESILEKLQELTGVHADKALKSLKKAFPGREIDKESCMPRINRTQIDADSMKLNIRFAIPSKEIGLTEQLIYKIYLSWLEENAKEKETEKDA